MNWLRKNTPIILAPRFWGIVATVILVALTDEGVISETIGYAIATIFGASTGVNIIDKFAKKISLDK